MRALQEIAAQKLSGRVTLGNPERSESVWYVYVGGGKVHYATTAIGQRERLRYLIARYGFDAELHRFDAFASDYEFLCDLWRSRRLTVQQIRNLLGAVSREALIHCAALPPVSTTLARQVGIDPLLVAMPIRETLDPVRRTIANWVQLRGDLSSPLRRLQARDPQQLAQLLDFAGKDAAYTRTLVAALQRHACLYDIARLLRADPLALALELQPWIRSGLIGTSPYRDVPRDRGAIACVDDSKTVQRQVKLILETAGYRVLPMLDPTHALSVLAREEPMLILMDISMPEINKYELCRLLRQSAELKTVPVVMLTGRDGAIDRLRARMVGATDYLTKPFDPQHLLDLVETSIAAKTAP